MAVGGAIPAASASSPTVSSAELAERLEQVVLGERQPVSAAAGARARRRRVVRKKASQASVNCSVATGTPSKLAHNY